MKKKRIEAAPFLDKMLGKLTLGGAVQAIRLCDEKSLQDFAATLGVPVELLERVETGEEVLLEAEAARWAKVLGYHEGHFASLAVR